MDKNKIFLSAIIPAYKCEKYIFECIKTLYSSVKFANVTTEYIILVNDKENKKYKFPSGCKVIINQENFGFAKSINQGAKIAKGKWLLFINSDTKTRKDTISKLIPVTKKHNIGVIAPKVISENGEVQPTVLDYPSVWSVFIEMSYLYKIFPMLFFSPQSTKSYYENVINPPSIGATYLMTPKKLFMSLGGFDENYFIYFEDIDYCKKLKEIGYKLIFENKAVISHIGHGSFGGSRKETYYLDSLFYWWKKHYMKRGWIVVKIFLIYGYIMRVIYWSIKNLLINNSKMNYSMKMKKYYYNSILYLVFMK